MQFTDRIQEEDERFSESSDEEERLAQNRKLLAVESEMIRIDADSDEDTMQRIEGTDSDDEVKKMNKDLNSARPGSGTNKQSNSKDLDQEDKQGMQSVQSQRNF